MRRRDTLALLSAPLLAGGGAFAQNTYPSKPVRFIVGFPPGGPTDIIARVLADQLKPHFGQPLLVDNRAGAAGNVAADFVSKTAADGYTLLYASSSVAISPTLFPTLTFDVRKSFAPITQTVSEGMVLLVHPGIPSTYAEFVRYARSNQGKLNYASSGSGTITHLAAALFSQQNGLQTQHIAYKGTAPALTDLIAGTVQFTIGTINTALPYIKAGRLKAVATTALRRAPNLPDVPTLNELGMKGFETSAWQGILAPAGTPQDVLALLSRELTKAMQTADFRARMLQQDAEVVASTPEQFTKYLGQEIDRWAQVIRNAGVKVE